jgi:GTP-binding protein HflX
VLGELGVETGASETKLLEIWNKMDLLEPEAAEQCRTAAARREQRAVCVSAQTGEGMDDVLRAIEEQMNEAHRIVDCTVPPGEGALANWLHENAQVLERTPGEQGEIAYRVRLSPAKRAKLFKHLGIPEESDAFA